MAVEERVKSLKPHEKLGPTARHLCYIYDAWIVGSSVNYIRGLNSNNPKDIDIVVPLSKWIIASKLIPEGAMANKFGGFKFEEDGTIYDVWTDEVSNLFLQWNDTLTAYQPKFKIAIGQI